MILYVRGAHAVFVVHRLNPQEHGARGFAPRDRGGHGHAETVGNACSGPHKHTHYETRAHSLLRVWSVPLFD